MDSMQHHLTAHRGIGRTYWGVQQIKNRVRGQDMVYICASAEQSRYFARLYDIPTLPISRLHQLRGTSTIPVFDHFAIASHISHLNNRLKLAEDRLVDVE